MLRSEDIYVATCFNCPLIISSDFPDNHQQSDAFLQTSLLKQDTEEELKEKGFTNAFLVRWRVVEWPDIPL